MYILSTTRQFERDYKLCKKRGLNLSLIINVFTQLEKSGKLPSKFRTHKLSGVYSGLLECHIQGDWLLIWSQDEENKEIQFVRTGTHSDLF